MLQSPVRLNLFHGVLPHFRPLGVLLVARHVLRLQLGYLSLVVEADEQLQPERLVLLVLQVENDSASLVEVVLFCQLAMQGLLDFRCQCHWVLHPVLVAGFFALCLDGFFLSDGIQQLLPDLFALRCHLLRRGLVLLAHDQGVLPGDFAHSLLERGGRVEALLGGKPRIQRRRGGGALHRVAARGHGRRLALAMRLPPLLNEFARFRLHGLHRRRLGQLVHALADERVAKNLRG
mmetsp:Transcript_41923/g.115606  ORF Transcript_41923/g.115606 Transcript_41923/m.115606 type:complete len:234 (+) Transcript_41923:221-922(+)